jgi:MFS family permease
LTARERYAAILRAPHVARLMTSALVARMPIGIDALAIVLFLRERTGSYAQAGIVAAAFALGGGAGAPISGRLVDRFGQRRVLLPLALAHAAGLGALVGLGVAGAPLAALIAAAVAGGAAIPPISAVLRPLWPGLRQADPGLIPAAYALDSVLIELVFVVGPLLTALATAVLSPVAALVVGCVMVIAGTVAFAAAEPSRAWRPEPREPDRSRLGALASPGVRTLVVATIPIGFCFGAMEVTLPAFSEDVASRAWAGVLIAVWSLGSAAGGLWFGARERAGHLAHWFVRLAALLPLGYLPLAAAPSLAVMLVLCVLAGLAIAPLLAVANQLIGDVAPAGALTEAYTWPITALVVGVALGNGAAGGLVEAADWRVAFLAASAGAGAGALVAFARRETLLPAGAPAVA